MKKTRVDVILHPIRLRLIVTIQGREMTPRQLSRELPDVPQASLYRHISVLEKEGIFQVVEVHPVRGAAERLLALSGKTAASIQDEELKEADKSDHLRYFTTFIISLLKSFENYMDSEDNPDRAARKIGYHTYPLYIRSGQMDEFAAGFHTLIDEYSKATEDDAERFYLSTIIMPAQKNTIQTRDKEKRE